MKASEIVRTGIIAVLFILALKMIAKKANVPGLKSLAEAV